MKHKIDGDQLMICADDFANLQESSAVFVPLDSELAQELLEESNMPNTNTTRHKTHFGYFDHPDQTVPAYDPGFDAICPACGNSCAMNRPAIAMSLMLAGDNRSYFYRMHKSCYEQLTEEQVNEFDGDIIDAVIMSKNEN